MSQTSISKNMWPRLSLSPLTAIQASPPELVTAAADAGFDSVGIRVCPAASDTAWPMLGGRTLMVRETCRRLDDAGLTVHDVEVLRLHPDKDPDEALHILDAAVELGARAVLVNGSDPDHQRQADRYADLCVEAESRGLQLSLEFMAFSEIRTLAEALHIASHASSSAAALVIDTLHLERSGGSPADLAAVPAELLNYVQLADTTIEPAPSTTQDLIVEAREDRKLPGDGDLPLASTLRACGALEVISIETPVRAHATLDLRTQADLAYRALRRTVETALPI